MKTRAYSLIVLCMFTFTAMSQTYDNPGGTINTCAGTFYDKGGVGANYGNNENITTTFCSNITDSCIRVSFTSFNLQSGEEFLKIYDGPDTTFGYIGAYTFVNSPGIVTSSKGCLTFKFASNASNTQAGWAAGITCVSACAPPVIVLGQTTSLCSGKFYDSGGMNTNYGNNEKSVTTLCSGIKDSCIRVSFTSFNLQSNQEFLKVYDGPDTTSGYIGAYSFVNGPGVVTSSKGCLTFKFASDAATTQPGWAADIACVSSCSPPVILIGQTTSLCSGKFYDSGGMNTDYGNNEKSITTLCSGIKDSCIRVSFTSFNLQSGQEFLKVYDGSDTTFGYLGAYTFVNGPGTITSSKGCLTFKFASDAATTQPGWAADVSCVSTCAPAIVVLGQTTSLCSGKFYDSGGANTNYGNNENSITTLCTDQPSYPIQVSFTSFNLQNGQEFLKVYDGPTTASALLGSYTFVNSPGIVVSSAGCLTFEFTSDAATTQPGWAADISCVGAVGINGQNELYGMDIILYDIPADLELSGALNSSEASDFSLIIVDLQGRTIRSQQLNAIAGDNFFKINLAGVEAGLYFVRISNNSYSIQKKFSKL